MNTTIKFMKAVLLFMVVQLFMFVSCNKNTTRPCQRGGYAFNAASEWSLQQEKYKVGDTIYLSSTIPKVLTDQINPSTVVDYNNSVGINGDLSIAILDSVSKQTVSARDSFNVFEVLGRFEERMGNQKSGVNFFYTEGTQSYQFRGGLICKRKGNYVVYVSNLLSNGLKGKDCTNATFEMIVTNTDKHVNIWQNALQIIPDEQIKRNMYCFRVQ